MDSWLRISLKMKIKIHDYRGLPHFIDLTGNPVLDQPVYVKE